MDGNVAQFVKILLIDLDLGKAINLKQYDKYRTFIKHYIGNMEARLYPKNTAVIEKYVPNSKHYIQTLLIFQHDTSKTSSHFEVDWDRCPIFFFNLGWNGFGGLE